MSINRFRKSGSLNWLPFIILLLGLLSVCDPLYAQGDQSEGIKAFWVIRDAITERVQVSRIIDTALQHNYNNIFIQVRGRGDAYYESEIVPKAFQISDKNFDPLKELIFAAHKEGIKVHAWMNVYLIWTGENKPDNREHLLLSKPKWSARSKGGLIDFRKTRNQFRRQVTEGAYLAPANPEVRQYLLSVFEELLTNYEVDGLHLDYVRYSGSNYGYNKTASELFFKEYGIEPETLSIRNTELVQWLGKKAVEDYRKNWDDFRLQSVTDLVSETKELIGKIRPGVALSAAVKADPIVAKTKYYQDWTEWVNAGIIDFAVPMNYSASLDDYVNNLEMILKTVKPEKLIMGIGTFNQNQFGVESKIYKARAFGITDFIFFSFADIYRSPEYSKSIDRAIPR